MVRPTVAHLFGAPVGRSSVPRSLGVVRLSALLVLVPAGIVASPPVVRVDDAQRITVLADGASLRAAVEEICWQSGILLRYDAVDEVFSTNLEHETLEEALARLFPRRSFLLTYGRDPDGASRPRVLHVLGRSAGVASIDPPPPPATADFAVPTRILEGAFSASDPERRTQAIQELVDNLRAHPEQMRAFLATDVQALSAPLRSYPDAPAVLREIRARAGFDARSLAKLDALIAALQ